VSERIALVVEDSKQYVAALEVALDAIPNLVLAYAADGEEAIRFLESSQGAAVCALLTDLNMPGMDGFQLIERLRSNPRHSRLPIVVLSGDTDPDAPDHVRRLGADAFFRKPYSPVEVRRTLERLLNA
jgi:CheY-like chemotaxis protein